MGNMSASPPLVSMKSSHKSSLNQASVNNKMINDNDFGVMNSNSGIHGKNNVNVSVSVNVSDVSDNSAIYHQSNKDESFDVTKMPRVSIPLFNNNNNIHSNQNTIDSPLKFHYKNHKHVDSPGTPYRFVYCVYFCVFVCVCVCVRVCPLFCVLMCVYVEFKRVIHALCESW